MNFRDTELDGVKIIDPIVHGDERGYFFESFRSNHFAEKGIDFNLVQVNRSSSRQGVLRGLHYQNPNPQGKLISVLKGCVFDVAVDIDPTSATYKKWVGVEISAENKRLLWIAPGYAHGFYVLSTDAEFSYYCTDYYHPESENSIAWNDPSIGIEWPLLVDEHPILSAKDSAAKPLE